ncbi:MAG: prephenate dehydrogenase [Clostridiales bacterium]|nr:prephenate dehydrogenase [Candidatus Equinaster intestinalis]
MKITENTKFLIIGLGLMGGSYAKGLTKAGYEVWAITDNQSSIDYSIANGLITKGSSYIDTELLDNADIIIFALYPKVLLEWIKQNGKLIKGGKLITDVTGIKSCIVGEVQAALNNDVEFISAHPMAGREVYGVENSDETIFYGANYIVVPTEKNTDAAITACKEIGKILKFARISELTPEKHDEMIAFLSQLAHCIAVCLMTCNPAEHLEDYTGDSFRDLTRIANINEYMWTELFLLNKEQLVKMMQLFIDDFEKLKQYIIEGDTENIQQMMRISTERRKLFNKREENI